MSFDSSVKFN
jgi:hypothetical protein